MMEVFGSLGFGRVIRTFLPGLMVFLAICLLWDSFLLKTGSHISVPQYAERYSVVFLFFAICTSAYFGLLLNTVFFLLRKVLPKSWFAHNHTRIVKLEEKWQERIRVRCWPPDVESPSVEDWTSLSDFHFLLPRMSEDAQKKLDKYMAYMEFQFCSGVSLLLLWVSFLIRTGVNPGFDREFVSFVVVPGSVFVLILSFMCFFTARLDLSMVRRYQLSYWLGITHVSNERCDADSAEL